HYHGVSVDAADITHRFIEEGELDLNLNTWLLAAKYLELKAKVVKKDIERLDMVSLPAVVWREDGDVF
ncbi:cysteine peptidase family C39 domain-containing protein, partial [Pseudomonas sp. F1_0610]|uniref:cysteine peptidase family C39 domain-containing protein n=1 Tax=Pseudomonas sp. F1_0610 TaxID=3114284 RepID=UPI0039C34C7A